MFRLKRCWILLNYPAALILLLASSLSPAFSEGYALTVYRWISRAGNAVTGLLPFSLAEILAVLVIAAAIAVLILWIVRLIHGRGRRARIFGRGLLNLFCAAGIVLFLFTISCGINYGRYTFAEISGLPIRESTVDELADLCRELAAEVNDAHEEILTDENGVMVSSFTSVGEAAEAARQTYDGLADSYPTLTAGYSAPKPVMASRFMSLCDITGIFFPFTFEANVNVDVPDYSIPATMCHELSHLRGYMREDEANFLAYLACRESSFADFRYSGAMLAFVYTNNALISADSELGNEIFRTLCDGAQADFAANSAYWKQFEGPVSEISSTVNDAYLKANRQEDGVRSYGRMVDLLLADYRHRHGLS